MRKKIDYTKTSFTQDEAQYIRAEVATIMDNKIGYIPILMRCNSKNIKLEKHKYLVEGQTTLAQFLFILRKKLEKQISSTQSIFLIINDVVPPSTYTMHMLYREFKDDATRMLIITLCVENTFG